eukprot:jgi/Chrpa1/1261/Chrysochromulina_OHIO_Genome00015884-RA
MSAAKLLALERRMQRIQPPPAPPKKPTPAPISLPESPPTKSTGQDSRFATPTKSTGSVSEAELVEAHAHALLTSADTDVKNTIGVDEFVKFVTASPTLLDILKLAADLRAKPASSPIALPESLLTRITAAAQDSLFATPTKSLVNSPFAKAISPSTMVQSRRRSLLSTEVAQLPETRKLRNCRAQDEHDLFSMQLSSARIVEDLLQRAGDEARWRRQRNELIRGWLSLVSAALCGQAKMRAHDLNLRAGWHALRQHARSWLERRRVSDGCRRLFIRALDACRARALRRWRERRVLWRANQIRLHLAIKLWCQRSPAPALRRWQTFVYERFILRHGLCTWRRWQSRRAINSWASHVWQVRLLRQLGRKALTAILHRRSRCAFNSWVGHASTSAEACQALGRGGAVSVLGGQRRAFHSFHIAAAQRRAALGALYRGAAALVHRSLTVSWKSLRAWRANCRHAIALMRNAHHALLHRQSRRAWNRWSDACHLRRVDLNLLRKGASVFSRRLERRLWNELKAKSASHRRRCHLMQLTIAKLVHLRLVRAWHVWRPASVEGQLQMRRVAASVGQWQRRGARSACLQWCSVGRMRTIIRRGASGLLARALRRACNSWHAVAQARMRGIRLLRRGIMAFANGLKRRMWNHLTEAASQARRHRQLIADARSRLGRQGVSRALASWAAAAGLRGQQSIIVLRALGSWEQRQLRRACNSWHAAAQARMRCIRLLRRGIMAFAYGLKRRMWNHLAARAALSRQQRALFPIALGRLYSRGRTRAWNAWVCATSGRQREQRRLWNACLEWQRRGMRQPWFHWRYVSRMRTKGLVALRNLAGRQARRAFNSWLAFWLRVTRAVRNLALSRGGFRFGKQRRAMNTWTAFQSSRVAIAAKLYMSAASLVLAQHARAFRTWRALLHGRKRTCLLHVLLRRSQSRRAVALLFRVWRVASLAQSTLRKIAVRRGSQARWPRREALRTAMLTWKNQLRKGYKLIASTALRENDELRSQLRAAASQRLAAAAAASERAKDALSATIDELSTMRAENDALHRQLGALEKRLATSAAAADATASVLEQRTLDAERASKAHAQRAAQLRAELERSQRELLATKAGAEAAASLSPVSRPTSASRGWRTTFSPDWKKDADASEWLEKRNALVAQTMASPAQKSPIRRSLPTSPTRSHTRTPSEYRMRKNELEHGRSLPGDPTTTVAYRSGFAWSQYAFDGPTLAMQLKEDEEAEEARESRQATPRHGV